MEGITSDGLESYVFPHPYPFPSPPHHIKYSPPPFSTRTNTNHLQQKYLPSDLKGKGEPSYSIEKALKEHKHGTARDHRRVMSEGQPAYEM
ncbi:MAG: hypothetical protein Q9169_005923, partial [Polycauliona sp. 2 TL-2023]